jgi:hypothetical protein
MARRPKALRLSVQQRQFVAEFMVDLNAKGAAERAGYAMSNTAAGNHLLAHPQVRDEIGRRMLARERKLDLKSDHILSFWSEIIIDPRTVDEGGPTLSHRMEAAREYGKLIGMYTQRIQVTGSLTLVDLLLAAERKAEAEQPALTQH